MPPVDGITLGRLQHAHVYYPVPYLRDRRRSATAAPSHQSACQTYIFGVTLKAPFFAMSISAFRKPAL
jgi:hypothetical protein